MTFNNNPYSQGGVAGANVSLDGQGRIISVVESALTHVTHADGLADKGDVVVCGSLVGVAQNSASASTTMVQIDTRGIYNLSVLAQDGNGNANVAVGDPLYIAPATCVISKIATGAFFGIALGAITGSATPAVIAVAMFPNQGNTYPVHEHTTGSNGGELTSPHIITDISDTNGKELIKVTATGSAVNEITVANAAANNDPEVSATGDDTNIGIKLTPKGTGKITLGATAITDAKDVTLATGTGTKIGTAANQKLGLWGVTPVVQQAHIADAATLSGGETPTEGEHNALAAKFNTLLAQLEAVGILAAS